MATRLTDSFAHGPLDDYLTSQKNSIPTVAETAAPLAPPPLEPVSNRADVLEVMQGNADLARNAIIDDSKAKPRRRRNLPIFQPDASNSSPVTSHTPGFTISVTPSSPANLMIGLQTKPSEETFSVTTAKGEKKEYYRAQFSLFDLAIVGRMLAPACAYPDDVSVSIEEYNDRDDIAYAYITFLKNPKQSQGIEQERTRVFQEFVNDSYEGKMPKDPALNAIYRLTPGQRQALFQGMSPKDFASIADCVVFIYKPVEKNAPTTENTKPEIASNEYSI